MGRRGDLILLRIDRFVQNPITNLVKGITLLIIGISDASRTFHNDIAHWHLHVGHGLIILGVFSILSALPHFADGLESASRFVEFRRKKQESTNPTECDPGENLTTSQSDTSHKVDSASAS